MGNQTILVTPLSNYMYRRAKGHNIGLGGPEGYFICSTTTGQPEAGFEILAKATTFESAYAIFNALTSQSVSTAA